MMFALSRLVTRIGKASAALGVTLLWYELSFRNRLQSNPLFKPSFAENVVNGQGGVNVDKNVVISEQTSNETDDNAEWETKREQCAFCRHFLQSPCSESFKLWSKCVDKAKAEDKDFIETCSSQTKYLMECTSSNAQYFQAAFPTKDEAGDDVDDGAQESSDQDASTDRNIDVEVKAGNETKS